MSKKGWFIKRVLGVIGGALLGIFTAGLGYIPAIAAGLGSYAAYETAVQVGSRYKYRSNLRNESTRINIHDSVVYKDPNDLADAAGDAPDLDSINTIHVPMGYYNSVWGDRKRISKYKPKMAVIDEDGNTVGVYHINWGNHFKWKDAAGTEHTSNNPIDKIVVPQKVINDADGKDIRVIPIDYLSTLVHEDGKRAGRLGRFFNWYNNKRGSGVLMSKKSIGGILQPKRVMLCNDGNCANNTDYFYIPKDYFNKLNIEEGRPLISEKLLFRDDFVNTSKLKNIKMDNIEFAPHNYCDSPFLSRSKIRTFKPINANDLQLAFEKVGKLHFLNLPLESVSSLDDILNA